MNEAEGMGFIESGGDLLEIGEHLSWCKAGAINMASTLIEHFGERASGDERCNEIGIAILLAEVIGGENVRMPELNELLGHAVEAGHKALAGLLGEVSGQHKDSQHDGSRTSMLASRKDGINGASAELLFDNIFADWSADELSQRERRWLHTFLPPEFDVNHSDPILPSIRVPPYTVHSKRGYRQYETH